MILQRRMASSTYYILAYEPKEPKRSNTIIKNKHFIEVSFPVKEVSEISAKEKNIRHGHISTLHIW